MMERVQAPVFGGEPLKGDPERAETDLLFVGLTHDMRSPLFAVLGYLQLLQKQLEMQKAGPALEYAKLARQAGLRLDHMVTELLDLIRFGNHLRPVQMQTVSLQKIFEKIWGTFQIIASQKQVRLNVVLKGDSDLLVRSDPAFLERALDNLLANAIKFSPPHTDVVLTGSQQSGRVIVEVTDHGRGIPKEAQATIFEPFNQTCSSDRGGGFGLGLAIVRFIARAHGGDIHVSSELGTGTCFTFWIPLLTAAEETRPVVQELLF